MLRRTFDASFLNSVANHPEVRPHIGFGTDPLDYSEVVADPNNVTLVTDHGGWIFHKLDFGLYEVHSQFLPEGRGSSLIEKMRQARRLMFTSTDCVELVTRVPDDNKPALGLARAAGFRESFRREMCWDGVDGRCGVSFQSLPLDRWRALDEEALRLGGVFHHALEAAKLKAGSALPVHADDEAHDRAVGASVLMMRAGNPRKAVLTYNRWARFAGYATITLVSEAPLLVDVVDALVTLSPNGDLEVLQCRE